MPELPEVETSRRGIEPHLVGATILHAVVRNGRLRWPVSEEIYRLSDQPVLSVQRRAKYLLLELPEGWIIIHLGMSGSSRRVRRKPHRYRRNRASLNRLLLSSRTRICCKLLRTRLRSRSRSKLRQLLVPLTRQNRRRRKKTNAAGWCSAVRSEARNRQRRYVLSWRSKALTRKSPPTMAGIVWSLAR